jgi:hypothetical protein
LELIKPEVAGDPVSGQCWLRRSLEKIRQALGEAGRWLSTVTIRRLLRKHGIRPKSNVKRLEGTPHPERDQQFMYIQHQREAFEQLEQPIISVDTKKKELIGDYGRSGQVWCDQAPAVNTHDFPSDAVGKAVPYGIYDELANAGQVYVGQSADTPEFAVANIAAWWASVGQVHYPHATDLLILADAGGSNGYRARCFKQQLQLKLADAFGLTVTVAHFPPGTSKWNPIEHRLFSQISNTWAGTPLTSFELALDGIRRTTTTTGLTVQAALIDTVYEKGVTVSDEEMASLDIERHSTCPQWNYTIYPRTSRSCF